MGGLTLCFGLHESYSIITHHIKTEWQLVNIHKRRTSKGHIYYSLDFKLDGEADKYIVDHISSTRKYKIGNTYIIFISNHDHNAYIHRFWWFFISIICIIMGIVWLQIIQLTCKQCFYVEALKL